MYCMNLVVIIPCLNEEKSIGSVIDRIPGSIPGIHVIAIIVVDDGSTDATADVARDHGARVISHNENRGVGAAFHTGIDAALKMKADIIINMDGDGQFDPEDIPLLVQPIIDGKADFVSASRFINPALVPEMPKIKKWGNHRIAQLVSLLIGKRFYDVSCGFRAYSREAALRLTLFGSFTYTQESFLDLAFKGLSMMEIPVKVRGTREFGSSRVASNLWKYAFNTSRILFRTFRDYKPLVFFSLLSLVMFICATALGGFFIGHYLHTGKFYPHKWAGFASGFMLILSIMFIVTGLVADMLDRIRRNQEQLLYYRKKSYYFGENHCLDD